MHKKKSSINEEPLPERAYVTFTNEYYLPLAEKLVQSLQNVSQYPVVVYSINCDVPFSYPNMIARRIDDANILTPDFLSGKSFLTRKGEDMNVNIELPDGHIGIVNRYDRNTYLTLSRKPTIILHALNHGLKEGVFLDADGIAKENIDTIFDYLNMCSTYPLVGKGLFEYMMLDGKGDPNTGQSLEQPLMDLLGVKKRTMHYVSTNVILFNNDMKEFIEEWKIVSDNRILVKENSYYAPYHDETIINVLLWKRQATMHLPVVHFNLTNKESSERFYNSEQTDIHLESDWQYIPANKDDVKFFHGCKSIQEIDATIEYIKDRRKPIIEYNYNFTKISFAKQKSKIAIVTLFDSYYDELSKISLPDKIKYAKKHGYDFIYFDDTIDRSRPPQWSKIKAIEYVLDEYDWVWWIDIDALIMNQDVKLESIVDDNYDVIFTANKYSVISNGSSFFKNTEFTKGYLKNCYELKMDLLKDVDVTTFDHEQKPMRILYQNYPSVSNRIKLIHERVCNSYWYTNNESVLNAYPNWNNEDNIYKIGDFVVNFCGRNRDERVKVMQTFIDIEDKSYKGNVQKFKMIDVVKNDFNKELETTDEDFWNKIYNDNEFGWWGSQSKSGDGSEGQNAEIKVKLITDIVKRLKIKSVVDFGCGDFNWMGKVDNISSYIGIDIVKNLIKTHKELYEDLTHKFVYGNIANEQFHKDFISEYGNTFDLGILFDILGHQTYQEIDNTLHFILECLNMKYLLVSNSKQCNPNYFNEKISRNESIDIEIHPRMIAAGFEVVARFENDLVLYKINTNG